MKASKTVLWVVLAALGVLLTAGSFAAGERFGLFSLPEVPRVLCGGFGGGLIGISVCNLVQMRLKNSNAGREMEIAERDERNIMLREKGAYGTFLCTMPLIGAITMVFVALDEWLSAILCGSLLLLLPLILGAFIEYYARKL